MGECGSGSASELECRQIAELLGDYFDGSLPNHLRELLEWHIDGCQPCVAFINTYRETISVTRRLPDAPMPVELKKRLIAFVKSARDPRETGSERSRSTGAVSTSPISATSSPAARNASRTPPARSGRTENNSPPDVSASMSSETMTAGTSAAISRRAPNNPSR